MKKVGRLFLFTLILMTLSSCGREKLTTEVQPITVNQLKNDRPINFSYQIDETQIDEYGKSTGKLPLFGRIFQAIGVLIANTSISRAGGHELELQPLEVDLSLLSSLDFDLVDTINLDTLKISIKDAKKHDDLNFVEKFEIFIKLDSAIEGLPVDDLGYSRIVYFDKSLDASKCGEKCISLNIVKVNWKNVLQTNKFVHLLPKISINSVPTSTMKLAGTLDFSVKFNLGF